MARALLNSLPRVLRSPPDNGVGWCFGAITPSKRAVGAPRQIKIVLDVGSGIDAYNPQCFAAVDNDRHIATRQAQTSPLYRSLRAAEKNSMVRCPCGKTFDSHDPPGSYSHRGHIYAAQATDGIRRDEMHPLRGHWLGM